MRDGALHLTINDPRSFLGAPEGDGGLEAFLAPEMTGQVAGFPQYDGIYVLLSARNVVLWVPVTIAEVLDREERRLKTKQEEWQAQKAQPWISEAKIRESYELLKQIDAAGADQQRAAMLQAMRDEQQRRPVMEAEVDGQLTRQSEALRAYRASFPPAQLQAQARVGMAEDGTIRADAPAGRLLVKVNPALSALDGNRIHFMRVFVGGVPSDPVAGRYAWTQRSAAALDLEALNALTR